MIIVKVLMQTIYAAHSKPSLPYEALTKDFFTVIPANVICLAAVMICHAIRDYESGCHRRSNKFEGHSMSGKGFLDSDLYVLIVCDYSVLGAPG